MNKFTILITILFLAGCAKSLIPMPNTLMPEVNRDVISAESYGPYPKNYQKILKDYLQENLLNHEDAKVDFINTPKPLSISQVGGDYTGHRVCLSINSKNKKSIYTGYKTHLFIINNDKVELHLYDSGLLKIPFSLCVETSDKKSIYIDEIPDEQEVTIDQMDKIKIEEQKDIDQSSRSNVYILCTIDDIERTFVFNQFANIFSESIGIEEVEFNNVEFSTTHIFGNTTSEEILINRVSGSIAITKENGLNHIGDCMLLDKKKF